MQIVFFKFFVIVLLWNLGMAQFPEPLETSFKFWTYSPTTTQKEGKQIEEKNDASTKKKGSQEGSKTDVCKAYSDIADFQKQSGAYIDLGSNDLYFRSTYDGYPWTIKFISFENYLQEQKFPSLLQEDGPNAWMELKKFVWRLYNLNDYKENQPVDVKKDEQNFKVLADKKKENPAYDFVLPDHQLVHRDGLLSSLLIVATMWVQTKGSIADVITEWKKTAFVSETFIPDSYERFLLQAYQSFIAQAAQERHMTSMLSKYSDDYEAPEKKTFVEFRNFIADTEFNFYMELEPIGRSFLEIRQKCPSPIGAEFDKQILFAFKMLYGPFVMHQKGYAHCNIELRNFVFRENLEDFYLIDFGRARSFLNKKKCQQGNPAYQAPEYSTLGAIKWINPFADKSNIRHHKNFELDGFAVGKAIVDMLVSLEDFKEIGGKHEQIINSNNDGKVEAIKKFYSAVATGLDNSLLKMLVQPETVDPINQVSQNNKNTQKRRTFTDINNIQTEFENRLNENRLNIAATFFFSLVKKLLSHKYTLGPPTFCFITDLLHITLNGLDCGSKITNPRKFKRYPIKIAIIILYEIYLFKNKELRKFANMANYDFKDQLNEKMIARIFRIASYLDDPMNVVKFYKLNAISLNDDKAPTANSSSHFETDESVSLFTNTIESIRKLLLKQKTRLQV